MYSPQALPFFGKPRMLIYLSLELLVMPCSHPLFSIPVVLQLLGIAEMYSERLFMDASTNLFHYQRITCRPESFWSALLQYKIDT